MMTPGLQHSGQYLDDSMAVARLVEGIGEDGFGLAFAGFLHRLCGADHFAAFRLRSEELTEVAASCVDPQRTARDVISSYVEGGWWRRDPAMTEAQRSISQAGCGIVHIEFSDASYAPMRTSIYPHVRDRLLLCGRRETAAFSLSVLRSDSNMPFAREAVEQLAASAELLISLLAKHWDVRSQAPLRNVANALTSLRDIEDCLRMVSSLPRREAEVCSRVLYGMSSVGIALDLAVGEETVKTYRKRAYQRLGIGCERELLNWYLALWGAWCSGGVGMARPLALH
ncbi:MAG TPA: helix-turn-helix transcriptional regulator [Ramlibacter sp.]|nr:helix-turn-helix transcriptional regulator [Ramlibacter sp.]